jgi:lactobin A/cerein 7B family class IIb bacteriocin
MTDTLRVLDADEIQEISGGFICGGLCVAGAAIAAGLLFGAGIAVGQHNAKE